MRRPTPVDRVMNEVTLYGGIAMRRADAYILASDHSGDSAVADYFAFAGPTVEVPDGHQPYTLEEARALLAGGRIK